MRVLIYASRHHAASRRLLNSVQNLSASNHFLHYDELSQLTTALHQPKIRSRIAVLFPGDRDELIALVALRHLFIDTQIILILPNEYPQTISYGYALLPRYISYADSDFADVAAVCSRLTERTVGAPTVTA